MPVDPQILAQRFGVNELESLPRDVSPREYFRGEKDGKSFIVMRYPDANEAASQELSEFIHIGEWLNSIGIKAPILYEGDTNECIAAFEDLGNTSFGHILHTDHDKAIRLYTLAVDVLKKLASSGLPKSGLPYYKDSRIHENKRQFVEYCLAYTQKEKQSNEKLQSFLTAWDEVESALPACPQGFVHGDYHLENLMFQNHKTGIKQCALIDYQDALNGPLPYDLVNILEDARMDVPADLRHDMINHYCDGLFDGAEKEVFLKWYRVLGTQFHCRVIGLFIKLAAEQNRDAYLIHINRLANYITDGLKDPVLSPVKTWFEKEGVDFTSLKDIDGQKVRETFRNITL